MGAIVACMATGYNVFPVRCPFGQYPRPVSIGFTCLAPSSIKASLVHVDWRRSTMQRTNDRNRAEPGPTRPAQFDPKRTGTDSGSGRSEVCRIEETFVFRKNGEAITKTSAVAKPNLPRFFTRRGSDFDLAGIRLVLFDRLTTKTARARNDLHD